MINRDKFTIMDNDKKRVMIAKIGLDGHDRGAKVVARALHDAGMEVTYTGIRQKIDDIVTLIAANDVEVLGLSFLAGDHMTMVPKVREKLNKAGRKDIPIIIGGIILQHQIPTLLKMGVQKVFLSGTPLNEIVNYVHDMPPTKIMGNDAASDDTAIPPVGLNSSKYLHTALTD